MKSIKEKFWWKEQQGACKESMKKPQFDYISLKNQYSIHSYN
jgi:hypothetical protein